MKEIIEVHKIDMPHRAWLVYLYLRREANMKDECRLPIDKIVSRTKLSRSTVKRAIRDLRKLSLIKTEQKYRANGGKSTLLYKIL